jgi:branched-subunit amino acid transport protein
MRVYGIIIGMALVTFAIRYVLFAAAGKLAFPPWFEDLLRFIPPSVLAAIIAPAVLAPQGTQIVIHVSSPHLMGALVALGVGMGTRNLFAVIISGMGTFWLWQWICSRGYL